MTQPTDNPRHCPSCHSVDLMIEGGVIACKDCGRILSAETADGTTLEDPEWVASAEPAH